MSDVLPGVSFTGLTYSIQYFSQESCRVVNENSRLNFKEYKETKW